MRSKDLVEGCVYKVGGFQHPGLQIFTGRFKEINRNRWDSKTQIVRVPLFYKLTDSDPSEHLIAIYAEEGAEAPKLGDVATQARSINPIQIESLYATSVERAIENLRAADKLRQQQQEEVDHLAGLLEGLTGRTWGTSRTRGSGRTFSLVLGDHEVEEWVTEMQDRIQKVIADEVRLTLGG